MNNSTIVSNTKSSNIKSINSFFQNKMKFFGSYFTIEQLPKTAESQIVNPVTTIQDLQKMTSENWREIAVIGRSNVGKSSLINAIAMNKTLAYTSKKPGCTVSINLYKITGSRDTCFLVDLPGYGYAERSRKEIRKISPLISNYLLQRRELRRLYLLIDSRVGVQPIDGEFMNFLNQNNIKYQIVLTKIDKSKKTELDQLEKMLEAFFKNCPNIDKKVLPVSSRANLNLELLRESIIQTIIE